MLKTEEIACRLGTIIANLKGRKTIENNTIYTCIRDALRNVVAEPNATTSYSINTAFYPAILVLLHRLAIETRCNR